MGAVLKLVQDEDSGDLAGATACPVTRVFRHWVLMMGKSAGRCALGPTRRRVIERALGLYDEETLLLAIEGCAASAWHAGQNDRGKAFNDLELILRDEKHIEGFASDGEELRLRHERDQRRRASEQAAALDQGDPAARAAAIESLKRSRAEFAARARGGR